MAADKQEEELVGRKKKLIINVFKLTVRVQLVQTIWYNIL